MANSIINFSNRIDEATLSGGSWTTALPLTNLQDRRIGKLSRSTDALLASTQFDIALTKDRGVRVVAIVNHNLSSPALWRVTGAAVADFSTSVYQSSWLEAWPALTTTEDADWEEDNWWDGRLSEEDRPGYTWNAIHVLPSVSNARYWRVEFDDTLNGDGYVQLGRVFIAGGWQPVTNISRGHSIGFETKTRVDEALSGAEYFDPRTPFRVERFRLDWLSDNEALARALDIDRLVGIDQEVLYVFDPDDTVHMHRRSFLGRMRTLSAIDFPYLDTGRKAYEIKELL